VGALKSISWLNETFDFIGWIESRSNRFAGKVVMDKFIFGSEEEHPIEIPEDWDSAGMLTDSGKVERLYYLKRILSERKCI